MLMLLLFSFCWSVPKAQQNEITEPELDNILKEIDYSKTKTTLVRRSPLKSTPDLNSSQRRNPTFTFGDFGLYKLMAYLFAAVLTIAVIYLIFSNFRIDKKLANREDQTNQSEEEHIEDVDVISKYDEALKAGNFRLALRFKFLEILQQLSLENKIKWKADKTNRDYANELRGTSEHKVFKKLANIFAWVWYGNAPIGEQEFNELLPEFNSFFNTAK